MCHTEDKANICQLKKRWLGGAQTGRTRQDGDDRRGVSGRTAWRCVPAARGGSAAWRRVVPDGVAGRTRTGSADGGAGAPADPAA